MNRVCPNCYREEGIRFNFEPNIETEKAFHQENWCGCGYNSPQEMMQDQDLGFDDPHWVSLTKYFLNEYYMRLKQGKINSKDEHIRFFLKLLKSAANNYKLSIELINRKDNEDWNYVYDGKSKKNPRINIFDSSSDLTEVPKIVVFDTLNNELLNSYQQSKRAITELQKRDIRKNRWIAGLTLFLIIVVIIAIFF
jgi:hypothetical protein